MAGDGFSKADFAPHDFAALDGRDAASRLRGAAAEVPRGGPARVPPRRPRPTWNGGTAMYAALIGEDEKAISEESLLGLSSEFFMQIEWLPGGRIEEGELIFDPVFELAEETGDPGLRRLCDEKCRGFIFNFVREYGDLEYVNIGRVVGSLSQRADDAAAAATSTSPRSSSAASRTRSSRSSACRSGASASTSTTASSCWTPSSSRRSTPSTSSTAGWAAANWA